jgi:hypothetical protein
MLAELDTYGNPSTTEDKRNVKLQLYSVLKHHSMKADNGEEVTLLAFFKLGARQGRVVKFDARKLQSRVNDFSF